jgi:predicted nuclease of predicted toxin-antitoxin system
MRFVVDMNLSPDWAALLAANGHDAVHWRDVGAGSAPDEEIMAWAAYERRVVLTADHDFAAALALGGRSAPSVVQLRTGSTAPELIGPVVLSALATAEDDLQAGAILTIGAGKARLRRAPGQTNATED